MVNDGSVNQTQYGYDLDGARYAPFDQITKKNVSDLTIAWQARTGALATGASEDQNTPIQVGDKLYLLLAHLRDHRR
uniref:hypothetical protein n=1 Tax=Pseudogemmobacter bohemicus TaxID=2250708 RepID=UPI0018E59A54|nr:hypothetical protein [Pseudogemmobacter bohemicus]